MRIETEREEDGRWIAEVLDPSGVAVHGASRAEAIACVDALALRVIAGRSELGEATPDLGALFAA